MQIEGTLIIELFNSRENNFRICKIDTNFEKITVSGYFDSLKKGVPYIFEGDYVIHKKYGRQFNCINVTLNTSKKDGIISYLSSDLFPGIGLSLAKKIYDQFGNDAIKKILSDKDILLSVTTEKKATIIYEALKQNEELNENVIKLTNIGLSNKEAIKAINYFKNNAYEIIIANPYELKNIDGISFKKCDEIALSLGFLEESKYRIEAVIIYILEYFAFKQGQGYLYKEELIGHALKFINYKVTSLVIEDILNELTSDKKIIFDEYYYLKEVYNSEINISNKLKKMNKKAKVKHDFDYIINYASANTSVSLDDNQINAVKMALENQISIISGGPGVGKTTIISAIIYAFKWEYKINEFNDLLLLAPTGKAARRMTELFNVPAFTVHKALGYNESLEFEFNEDNHLPYKYVIVDEVSMLDVFIANALINALDDDAKIVFVGDYNQLPSVNVGNVLADLINSKIFETTFLETIYRQNEQSGIVKLSKMILNGNIDYDVFNSSDLRKLEINEFDILENVYNEFCYYLDLGYKFNEIICLAPLYRGNSGITSINKYLQERFNKSTNYIEYNDIYFKENDRVIQLKNNVEKNISNGDTGIIKTIKNDKDIKLYVDFDGDVIEYSYEELNELNLAYCLSIHKSQGSEYPCVILCMFRSYSIMLKKRLFYTAVSRAKSRLSIICDSDSMMIASTNFDDERRSTLIDKFLQEKIIIDGYKFDKQNDDYISPYDFLE